MSESSLSWDIRFSTGTAAALHDGAAPDSAMRAMRVLEVDSPTLVLGSSQRDTDVDIDALTAAGIALARRRSGGGAVLLVPGDHVWVDLWIPAGDPLWDDDVVRAAEWVGDLWAGVAIGLGLEGVVVHHGSVVDSQWSRQVCFAGRGPGEVFSGEQKLVGVSQRRNREWIRVQTMVHRRWDAATTFSLFAVAGETQAAAAEEWADRVGEVGSADVVSAVTTALPS